MIRGSCLCGTLRWRIEPPVDRMTHCHCSMCRKAHGAPFATYMMMPASRFSLVAGEEALRRYDSSSGLRRSFCGRCGSVGPDEEMGEDGPVACVPAGCLDDDPGARPEAHIYVASRAPWHVIGDDGLPRHDASSSGGEAVSGRPQAGPTGDVLHGSCLCGGVAFEVRSPLKAVHACHCSRCRKARAAAHTTNGFVPGGAVRFTRGESLLESFKLPDARYFTQVFCSTCGSGMPRIDPERGIAVIPMGVLDDDPGRGADDHIYVGSMATWYTIADDLPRFEEGPG